MSMENDELFAELNEIHSKSLKSKEKDSMFDFDDEEQEDDDVQRTVKINTDTKKKYAPAVTSRTQEEYQECIESTHYETLTYEDGTTYEVLVTVLKPGANPLENMKPAYAYSTNF